MNSTEQIEHLRNQMQEREKDRQARNILWAILVGCMWIFVFGTLLFTNGCTSKTTYVSIELDNETECEAPATTGEPAKCISVNILNLKADGAVFDTDTDQTTDGQVPISLYGANSATGGQVSPIANYAPFVNEVLDVGKEKVKQIFADKKKLKTPEMGKQDDIVEPAPIVLNEEPTFHHMIYGTRPAYAGNGLMQCPGDIEYDSCRIDGEIMNVKRKNDKGRTHWWPADHKMHPDGAVIICKKGDETYQYTWKHGRYPECR